MAKEREQRIKLRVEGSPVKFDATIMECTPDAKKIIVRFDGPMEDATLYAFGDHKMISDMKGSDGQPVDEPRMAAKARYWEVL